MASANTGIETPSRIEPARLDQISEAIADAVAELAAGSAALGKALHPRTAENLADAVRAMNCYYSNLIEGHNTRPRDIERALAGDLDGDVRRRNLQLEAFAHIRVQKEIDRLAARGGLSEPASTDFIRWLHREFYRGAHIPPSSRVVADFMAHFARRYAFAALGNGARILCIPAAHHRLNYIHPFADGNGRVSRLMSHAMAHQAGIGAHGLWSISRGLARGLHSRAEYKSMMDQADTPRQGDLDGRGNLSLRALEEFTLWFLKTCIDQVRFMSQLFELNALSDRYRRLVGLGEGLKPEAARLLEEALIRGEFERGEASRISGLPERSARRLLNELTARRLLGSDTAKGPVSLRFPADALETLFPRLYPEA